MMKSRYPALLSVLLLMAMGLPSWGQERSERRAPAREERRERLRALGGGVLDNLVKPLLADPKEQARGLDVNKINRQVAALLETLTDGDTAVETLNLEFDPERTRLGEDTIALRGLVDLRHSAWSREPSHARFELHGHLDRDRAGPPHAILEGAVQVETDVVALVGWALERARAKMTTEDLPPLPTAEQLTKQRLAIVLADVPPPRDMDEVADLFTLIGSEQMPGYVTEIAELKHVLDTEDLDPERRDELLTRLDKARRQRDRLFETRPKIHRNDAGRVEAITIFMENSDTVAGAHIEHLELEITEQDMHGRFSASMQRGAQAYLLFKPLAFGLLKRFQDRDPEINQQTEGLTRWYYSRARDELIGREF